jgi:nitrile hydratase
VTLIHEHGVPEIALRVEALESLLIEKGLVSPAAVDAVIKYFEQDVGPLNGATAVARAWLDPDYKARLLEDASSAFAELGITVRDNIIALENTTEEHNVVVCTLCSCYPWSVLGLPPTWYKAPAYRSRVVREPRKVLAEMGLELPESTAIRVWDSSAEIRYMVVPKRPDRTGLMTEDELQALVTRDSMIGVAQTTAPDAK